MSTGRCPTIYGPKKSRRQGLSLGINLGPAESKLCTWSCVYCQCGFGSRVEEITGFPSEADVLNGLRESLLKHPDLDSVTFAGNSEPTAHPAFLSIVRSIRELREEVQGRWIFNCLSNGSELDQPAVREACDLLDEAWIKLDCVDEPLFKKLNRPASRVGTAEQHVARIRLLKKPRLQTLLWRNSKDPAWQNDVENNLRGLLDAYAAIKPIMIHLTTVQRDPALKGLEPVPAEALEQFASRIRKLGIEVGVYP